MSTSIWESSIGSSPWTLLSLGEQMEKITAEVVKDGVIDFNVKYEDYYKTIHSAAMRLTEENGIGYMRSDYSLGLEFNGGHKPTIPLYEFNSCIRFAMLMPLVLHGYASFEDFLSAFPRIYRYDAEAMVFRIELENEELILACQELESAQTLAYFKMLQSAVFGYAETFYDVRIRKHIAMTSIFMLLGWLGGSINIENEFEVDEAIEKITNTRFIPARRMLSPFYKMDGPLWKEVDDKFRWKDLSKKISAETKKALAIKV